MILYKSSLNFGELAGRSKEGAREGLQEAGDMILAASNADAPKVSGDLVGSARNEEAGELERRLIYTSVYARWIHEHLWFKHPHGGGAKYLERALVANGDKAREIVADSIKAAI
jgi:hypothetical protein